MSEKQISAWLDEVFDEDLSEAETIISDHDTESEEDISDDDDRKISESRTKKSSPSEPSRQPEVCAESDDESYTLSVAARKAILSTVAACEPDASSVIERESEVSTACDHESETTTEPDPAVAIVAEVCPIEDNESEMSVENTENGVNVYGKNRYKWFTAPIHHSRTRQHNIIRVKLPQLRGEARTLESNEPIDFWRLIIDDKILDLIVTYTNAKITELAANYGKTASFTNHTDIVELNAFLGLLYLSGVFKSGNEDVQGLWKADGTGRDIFRATMSLERFLFLLIAVRFDDSAERQQRKESGDRTAPISEIFEMFIANCKANYTPSEFLTVDEMLVGFRGRCLFRMYIKSKPQKYGLKIMCLCDAKRHYLLNAFIYSGKWNSPNPRKLSIATQNVLSLVMPYAHSHRNITGDNWFSSVELVDELLKVGLTYIGTLRKNKREIPNYIVPTKKDGEGEKKFVFTRDKTLVSYVPKKGKFVCLISSMHHDNRIAENGKPEIIEDYNRTKGGVDSLDQKCANYSVQRRKRRWPLAIFMALMDIASVNAHVLFTSKDMHTSINRRDFGVNVGKPLVSPHIRRRLFESRLPRALRATMKKIVGEEGEPERREEPPKKRRRCYVCPSAVDNKHSTVCSECNNIVCKKHCTVKIICNPCNQEVDCADSDE